MLNKYQNEWANYIVKTEETELLLVDKQKHIPLETFGQNKTTANKRYSKCGVCVFVETFEIFTYICAGRQLSNNLFPHLP